MVVQAPFPYFGGKSTIAPVIWEALGDVPNYVEPFFGSGAVLLGRPDSHQWRQRIETVNDLDGAISNFWRAAQAAPDDVARWADWPVNENDLHARHAWLVEHKESLQTRLEGDPDFYDAKMAGWWLWGICLWIGSGWCNSSGPWCVVDGELVKAGSGVKRQLVHLGNAGMGINGSLISPDKSKGLCKAWSDHLLETMLCLSDRLRRVRVCCGDWSRVCGPSQTFKLGVTGVFLDPPYAIAGRTDAIYTKEMENAARVREWALANGNNPDMRIALCGYKDEHDMPGWTIYQWKTSGGYGSQAYGQGRENAAREMIWFSPHCQRPSTQLKLCFDEGLAR